MQNQAYTAKLTETSTLLDAVIAVRDLQDFIGGGFHPDDDAHDLVLVDGDELGPDTPTRKAFDDASCEAINEDVSRASDIIDAAEFAWTDEIGERLDVYSVCLASEKEFKRLLELLV